MTAPYPLVLKPIFKEKVWGGRALERLGKSLPPGAMIGESWELADLDSTSADGGGGGAERSIISNGPLAGKTVHDALREWGTALLGDALARASNVPLLVKYLDARENLSVQVHPSREYAAGHAGAHLKTESWYILGAEPGAVIYKGLRAGVTRGGFEQKLRAGESIVGDLIAVPVRAGDVHHLPSGTCHALGAGVLVAEVQTPSDTTYRVYDWGRSGRKLHIDEALECIEFGPPERIEPLRAKDDSQRTELVRTEYYTLSELRVPVAGGVTIESRGRAAVLMCLRGSAVLRSIRAEFGEIELRAGVTALLPAACAGAELVSRDGAGVLEARVG
jgi:mannose-6-phosphate isomerase